MRISDIFSRGGGGDCGGDHDHGHRHGDDWNDRGYRRHDWYESSYHRDYDRGRHHGCDGLLGLCL
ncbi:MAG: hypothetical protein ACRDRN_27480 [Sciscionella sp.]